MAKALKNEKDEHEKAVAEHTAELSEVEKLHAMALQEATTEAEKRASELAEEQRTDTMLKSDMALAMRLQEEENKLARGLERGVASPNGVRIASPPHSTQEALRQQKKLQSSPLGLFKEDADVDLDGSTA